MRQVTRHAASAVAAHARDAARTAYAARMRPPEGAGRLARFAFGAGLLLALLRIVLADPAARRRYLRTCAAQAALTAAVAAAVVVGLDLDDVMDDGTWHLQLTSEELDITSEFGDTDPEAPEAPDDERSTGMLAFWSSLYATLCAVEWVVIALSHEHQDAIGRSAALLAGVPPEDPEITPRVRVDLRWMRTRLRRKLRGAQVFVAGLPLLALLTPLPLGAVLYAGATTIWGAYWIPVFVAARSALAWKEEATAPPPWFLRGVVHLTSSVPGFRWWLPRAYVRLWRWLTAQVFSPAASFERSPYELAGLAVVRALCTVPFVYTFARPLVPTAAAQILVLAEERGREPIS